MNEDDLAESFILFLIYELNIIFSAGIITWINILYVDILRVKEGRGHRRKNGSEGKVRVQVQVFLPPQGWRRVSGRQFVLGSQGQFFIQVPNPLRPCSKFRLVLQAQQYGSAIVD